MEIKTVAFDVGGVLAYQNLSALTEEEQILFRIYMNRNHIQDPNLIEYASKRMPDIFLKIYKLSNSAMPTLEALKDMKKRLSIWTNNIGAIDGWFEHIGLYRYVKREDIINSFYIGVDKPNIEFYRIALKHLRSAPQNVLFLDDNSKNIRAAIRCGITGILYHMPPDNLKDIVIPEIKKRGK